MKVARRVSQVLFLLLFIYLFFQASYPLESRIPPDIFLRFDPLVGFATSIASRALIASLFPALILLLFTALFGRFFCGWICPLGTLIDGADRIINLKQKKSRLKETLRYRSWKFFILVAILISSLFSVQFLWLVDPIALLTRTLATGLFPMVSFAMEELFGLLMNIEFLEESMFDVFTTLQDSSLLPLEPRSFQSGLFFLAVFIGILSLGFISKRFWCRNLCPLGALLGIFSKFRLFNRTVDASCTSCGICQRTCKMDAIEDDFTTSSSIECIECMNCVANCPQSSIRYQFRFPTPPSKIDLSRRKFFSALSAGAIVPLAIKSSYLNRSSRNNAIRPPGALPENKFLDRCIRCHECTRICSTTGGCLQPALLQGGWEGLMTPISIPRSGYCEYNCNLCGKVCPTGAIKELALAEKNKMKMGTASFDKNRCIPWYRHVNCLVCEEHCPTPEKAIKFDERETILPDGSRRMVKYPYVVEELCTGCGICVYKCPLAGHAGIFVSIAGEIRWEEKAESESFQNPSATQ
ncbi:4Fe-4S binding protein [candidate division KSB1 bacterium]|nr:4Fe-4S binding protein [candidate division KSB1 bacterium]